MNKRLIWAPILILALLVPVGSAGAIQEQAAAPGDPELVNFAHVYNFTPTGTQADGKGTDIEFYTSTVPKRDYATGQLLDEAGNPLPEGTPPVMVTRDYAIMGSYGGGGWVFDITDPEAPQFVKNIPCNQTQNDVQLKQFGERWVLALARDGGTRPCITKSFGGSAGGGIAVFDVTDPYAFTQMYSFRSPSGAHNFTFHPTKPYGWISNGDITGLSATGYRATIPIIDFTDVDNPTLATELQLNVGSPHDITFSADGLRAFVANENNHRIFDTTDPKAPTQLAISPNPGTYSHGYDPTPDRKIVVHTNESLALGGFFAGGTTVCPGEGLTFYSIEGDQETRPVPRGHFLANVQGRGPDDRACTGHVGKLGNKGMVTGWYIGGVRAIDFSNPSQPSEAGSAVMPGAEVWAAKFYKGPYVYAADMRRGFDVFRWTGQSAPPWEG
jgi:hypothetical protein